MKATNHAASIRARLLNRARTEKADFNLMLTRDSLKRLLYLLSVSPWADQFRRTPLPFVIDDPRLRP